MRWYSWSTYGGIGEVMVEPRWISWAPDASVAVLAYDDTLVLCRTRPTFSAFASLPLKVPMLHDWHVAGRLHWIAIGRTSRAL